MRQAAFYLLLSLATASLNTGEDLYLPGNPNEIKVAQETQILCYVFCWILIVGVAVVAVTFVTCNETRDEESTQLKESLLPSHFYPRKGDCYYSAPRAGNAEILNNLL